MNPPAAQDKAEHSRAGVVAGRPEEEHKSPKAKGASAVLAGGLREGELQMPSAKNRVTKKELYAYYLYYVGNSGLSLFNFAPTQFQNLLNLAGHNLGDPSTPCDDSVPCVLPFAGNPERNVASIVLVCNGISFALQVVLFLVIGSLADFGRWRPWILIGFTALSVGISIGWLGVEDASRWEVATGLYIVGLIAYQGSLTFWTSAFPQVARNLPEMHESQAKLISGETTPEKHNQLDSLSRNRIANMAFAVCSCGEVVVLAILVGILFALNSDASTEANTKALSVVCAYAGAVWMVCAMPHFLLEKHRPGRKLPEESSYWTIGFKVLWQALIRIRKLTDTCLYLAMFFLMSDVLNTTVTVISTLQYATLSFNTLQLTYLLIVGIVAQAAGIFGFWYIQKWRRYSTKTMFTAVCVGIILLTIWGMIGNWTHRFGFLNAWEFWAYQVFYGLIVCPWYAYSQTMISDLIPVGTEFLMFALFGSVGKTSAFIGPFVTSAISARTNNTNSAFFFLFALGIVSCTILPFINVERSNRQCARFLEEEARELYTEEERVKADSLS